MAVGVRVLFVAAVLVLGSGTAWATDDRVPPSCKSLPYTASLALHPKEFAAMDLELAFDDYRSWVKKKIKSYVSLAKRGHARKAKRNPATIFVTTRTGVRCSLRAEIRAHGDLDDHYPGNLDEEPSLNIKLTDGHLFGITKFILFRPETRNGANEVFVATLLQQAGFLAPRTAMARLRLSGSTRPAVAVIFQEKIVKEFLEVNNVREGPIIEGDERFAFGHKYAHLERGAALGRVSNYKWVEKGPTSFAIAHRALAQMNRLFYRFDKSWATIHGSNMVDVVQLKNLLDGPGSTVQFVNYPVFEALTFATGATHGFSQDDRRAIYDPFWNSYTPIYYDGGADILTTPMAPLDRNITRTAQQAVAGARDVLDDLDRRQLRGLLAKRDVVLTAAELTDVISNLHRRLGIMAETDRVEPTAVTHRMIYNRPDNLISYVFPTSDPAAVEVCRDSLAACERRPVDGRLRNAILAQSLTDKPAYPAIYFAFPKSELGTAFAGFHPPPSGLPSRRVVAVDDSRLDLIGDIDAAVDETRRLLTLTRRGKSGRAVISGATLANWAVRFSDVSAHVKDTANGEQNFDQLGITGCLNFMDMALINVQFEVVGARCEDAVNFVRVRGALGPSRVADAAFDAVDADFSELQFGILTVIGAGNDCLDLSYGRYAATSLRLQRCGDKAVSVGETSVASIRDLEVSQATIGLAAKDYGSIALANGQIKNVQSCYALYNKKQEFAGGYLTVAGQLECDGAAGAVDSSSLVELAADS